MLPLGHTGIGLQVAKPFRGKLPLEPLVVGTLLPDLIDKPLYYGLSLATGRHGFDIGLISGTRTIGHTILFTAALAALARARRSKVLSALALGSATHLVLDVATDVFTRRFSFSMSVWVWPLLGWQFPGYAYTGLRDHLGQYHEPFLFLAELVGATLLYVEWRRRRRTAP